GRDARRRARLLWQPGHENAEFRPACAPGYEVRELPRAIPGVWRLTLQFSHRLARQRAGTSQPLLLPAARRAEHVPVPASGGLRRLFLRTQRRARSADLL